MNQGPLDIIKQLEARIKATVQLFESQTTASKVNVMLLVLINKEVRCAWCI